MKLFVYAKNVWDEVAQSVQRMATGWMLRGSNPGGGREFPHPFRPALGPTQPLIQWVMGLFPGGKQLGRSVDRPPPSCAEVKEKAELYLYSPTGPLWPLLWRTLPLPLPMPKL
jgi:hypothetical protein